MPSLSHLLPLGGYTFFASSLSPYLADEELAALYFTSRGLRSAVDSLRGRRWMHRASMTWFRPGFDWWHRELVTGTPFRFVLTEADEPSSGGSCMSPLTGSFTAAQRHMAVCRLRAVEKEHVDVFRALMHLPLGPYENRYACLVKAVELRRTRVLADLLSYTWPSSVRLEILHTALLGVDVRVIMLCLVALPDSMWAHIGFALKAAVRVNLPAVATEIAQRLAASHEITRAHLTALFAETWPDAARHDMVDWIDAMVARFGVGSPFSRKALVHHGALRTDMLLCALRFGSVRTQGRFDPREVFALACVDDRVCVAAAAGDQTAWVEQLCRRNLPEALIRTMVRAAAAGCARNVLAFLAKTCGGTMGAATFSRACWDGFLDGSATGTELAKLDRTPFLREIASTALWVIRELGVAVDHDAASVIALRCRSESLWSFVHATDESTTRGSFASSGTPDSTRPFPPGMLSDLDASDTDDLQ
jgi:hypothetical protein